MAPRRTFAAGLLALLCCSVCALAQDLKLQQVDRKINLNSQLVRVTDSIKVKNTGSSAADRVILCTLASHAANLAFQKVTQQLSASKAELKVTPTKVADAPAEVACFEAALKEKLPAGETASLEAFNVYAKLQTPFPAEIGQTEAQLMVYTGNLFVLSPYQVSAQSIEVVTPNSNIKSYTDEKPTSKSDNKVRYGKYDLVKPFTLKELRVHFENNKPFKQVTTLIREIEVSHWGNVYVEETYELRNAGAKHKGSFSRLKYAHNHNGKGNSFRDLRARLPAAAHSLYYVDLIGNISSSDVRKNSAETLLDFDLRYPLMGGWKADFVIGYSLPLKGILNRKRSDGKLRLTMALSSPLDDVLIDDLVVRVVLPEGTSNIQALLPYDMEQSFDKKFTYLDTTGRPVLVLHKKNLVPEHQAKFSVDYSFSTSSMLREPLLLISVFAVLLGSVVVYNRLEFTISKDDKWRDAQEREKLATVMQSLQGLFEEQLEVVQELGKAARGVRSADDVDDAQRQRSSLENDLKELEGQMREQVKVLEDSNARVVGSVKELGEKVKALQAKAVKLLAERCDLAKKGTSASDLTKKVAQATAGLADSHAEVDAAVQALFAPY